MAQQSRRSPPKKNHQKQNIWHHTALYENGGIVLLFLAAFMLLALLSFHPDDPSFNQTGEGTVHNLAGTVGAHLSDVLLQTVGYSAGWLVFLLGITGIQLFQYGKRKQHTSSQQAHQEVATFYWGRMLAVPMLMVVTAILSAFFPGEGVSLLPSGSGGVLGTIGAGLMQQTFGLFGSFLLIAPVGILGLMILTRFSLMIYWERVQTKHSHPQELAKNPRKPEEKTTEYAPLAKQATVTVVAKFYRWAKSILCLISPEKFIRTLAAYGRRVQVWHTNRQTAKKMKAMEVEAGAAEPMVEAVKEPMVETMEPTLEPTLETVEEEGGEEKTAFQEQTTAKSFAPVAYVLASMTTGLFFVWRSLSTFWQKTLTFVTPPSSPEWLEPMDSDPEPEFFPLGEEGHQKSSLDHFPDLERQASYTLQTQEMAPELRDKPEEELVSQRPGPTAPPVQRQAPQAEVVQSSVQPAPLSPRSEEPPFEQMVFSSPDLKPEEKATEEITEEVESEAGQVEETCLRPNPIFLWPESPPSSSIPPKQGASEAKEEGENEAPFLMDQEISVEPHLEKERDTPEVNLPKEEVPEVELAAQEGEAEEEVPQSSLPPFSLMVDPGPERPGMATREELNVIARMLEQKLADFKIKGQIIDVLPGPVVTTFELDPAPGLRAAKVIGLADDLARSISVASVRIVGNVPGKTVIGIEIPNIVRQTVYLKEVLASEPFRKIAGPLAVALGSDIFGNPVAGNLAKMPHLLVAGTTGSGKSVAVNAMICSLLFSARPDEVRFLMVDPKMLELSIYEGIPHLLAPVVTDVNKAANLLKWAVGEMEARYRLMSELGVRSLTGFNERVQHCIERGEQPTRRVRVGFDPETGRPVDQEEPIPLETKPLIVIVIDELADLMIQVGKEVEPAIARLAQMARAAGLHLIIATQRPSVDVITGLIKANFPTRLAFQVSSKIDSRTILDAMGADRLLGMGDGLFLPPGTSHLKRIHAPFVSDKEVHDLVGFLKTTGTPDYDNSVLMSQPSEGEAGEGAGFTSSSGGEEQDELYDQAVGVVIRARKVSTSMVQRHFKIGYNRAARIVERMEKEGLVSEANGAGKREVLAPESGA